MKVSVIVPAHNEEGSIAETLQCLLVQDYSDYEIIVVNNASTDRTVEVASQFPNVRVVHESRKGLLWARECGRKHATGDIVANIDADCLPSRDWLSRGVKQFTSPKVVAVTGPYDYYDASPRFQKFSLFLQKSVYSSLSLFLQRIHKGAVLIGGNNFIRAAALRKVGGYDTTILFYGEDTDTAKRLATQGKVSFNNFLIMKTSARRFSNEGTVFTSYMYFANFFWFTFFRRSFDSFINFVKRIFHKRRRVARSDMGPR